MSRKNSGLPPRPVERPLFIIGTGRSGTTLLFDLLHRHPDLCWPCQFMTGEHRRKAGRILASPPFTAFRRFLLKGSLVRRMPVEEPYAFWDRYFPGFRRPCRDLSSGDVHGKAAAGIREAVESQLRETGRKRFLTKYTGWSRIEYVDAIFPDACYVNVVRDGRAVAWSLLNVDWWKGWNGPSQWRWGDLAPEDRTVWEQSGKSFFVLAGLQWKILMENITARGSAIGDRYREVRYEDLIASPAETVRGVLRFAGLSEPAALLETVRNRSFHDANLKWKEQAGLVEQQAFDRSLGETLAHYGYL